MHVAYLLYRFPRERIHGCPGFLVSRHDNESTPAGGAITGSENDMIP